jgi:small subunit ribosomal protein S16
LARTDEFGQNNRWKGKVFNYMAVKLRLMRVGKKKQPSYRVVAADVRFPRDGRFLEIVGTYAPRGRSSTDQDAVIAIDNAKAIKWLQQGAKPTETVGRLLEASGAIAELRSSGAEVSG